MRGSRHERAEPSNRWPAGAAPHGYDQAEFHPAESRRDYPPRRRREPDEERRLLREAAAAFTGPERRTDMDHPAFDADDAPDGSGPGGGESSRLYRD